MTNEVKRDHRSQNSCVVEIIPHIQKTNTVKQQSLPDNLELIFRSLYNHITVRDSFSFEDSISQKSCFILHLYNQQSRVYLTCQFVIRKLFSFS